MLGDTGDRLLARAISMRVISPFCGSIELALIHTDGTGKGLEVSFGAKGLAGLDGLDDFVGQHGHGAVLAGLAEDVEHHSSLGLSSVCAHLKKKRFF